MGYLFGAYVVFWAVPFIFVFSIAHRQKRLQREIETLKKALEGKRETQSAPPASSLQRERRSFNMSGHPQCGSPST